MITRRSFLSLLASLPFVGKYVQRDHPWFFATETMSLDEYKNWYMQPAADSLADRLYPTPGFESFPSSTVFPARIEHLQVMGDKVIVVTTNGVYELDDTAEARKLYPPRLTFAEWDRKY